MSHLSPAHEAPVAALEKKPRITFITNFASHYRVRTFELIAQRYDARFLFYSDGGEANWLAEHGISAGPFPHEYLRGFSIGGVRLAPRLLPLTWMDDSDVIIKCINGKFALPIVFSICLARRRPLIVWTGVWSVLDSPANRWFARFNNFVYRHADAIVTYGHHVTRYLIEQGVDPRKIFTSKHAVTNSLYSRPVTLGEIVSLRKRLAIPAETRIILSIGRLVPVKGLHYLIRAFAEASPGRNACLVLVGTGPERQSCENLVRELGIGDRVRFPGYIPPADTVAYYAASYAFVLSSITWQGWKETWGLVINEAFNQGVPAITTDAVGAAAGGLVLDGENGFIVPEQNSTAIAVAISRLLDDPDLRDRFSANARSFITTWDQEHMANAFSDAIEHVILKCKFADSSFM